MRKTKNCIILLLSSTFCLEYVNSRIPCDNQTVCYDQLGSQSSCVFEDNYSGYCSCQDYQYIDPFENSTCQDCPGFGESCQVSNCCRGDYLVCYQDVCKCIYDDYCWLVSSTITNSERLQFQRIAQCVLAVALILTAGVLFILFWNACNRRKAMQRHIEHQMPADSFLSLNSIQRLVLMQLQDRPPPYSPEPMKPWKNLCEITEPPPSYVEAVGLPTSSDGIENPGFISENITSTNGEHNIHFLPSYGPSNIEISSVNHAPSIQISFVSWDQPSTSESIGLNQNSDNTARDISISQNPQPTEHHI